MLAFISFLLVIVGSLNWFCIGILQYDFVAGLFGSQSNVFSRLIYTLVGIASIIVTVNLIKNKGKFIVSFKKANKEYKEYMNEMEKKDKSKLLANTESGKDMSKELNKTYSENDTCECGKDCDCDKGKDCDCNNDDKRE